MSIRIDLGADIEGTVSTRCSQCGRTVEHPIGASAAECECGQTHTVSVE